MSNIIEQWNNAAEKYAADQERSEYVESNKFVVMNRFKDLSGQKVLDLGCGYGNYAEYFRSIGAKTTGIDGSINLLNIARDKYPDVTFVLADLTKPIPLADGSFDLVFCNQVLMDIENIESVFAEIKRLLKPNGIFYYSIVHPAFYVGEWQKDANGFKSGKLISSYIETSTSVNYFWGETTHFHRPLSYYLNLAADIGFILRRTEEPKTYDGVTKSSDIPLFFFAEYIKAER